MFLLFLILSYFPTAIDSFSTSFPGFPSAGSIKDGKISFETSQGINRMLHAHPNIEDNQRNHTISCGPSQNVKKYNVSLLLVDHYDSFTYNLCDMLAQLTTGGVTVVAKDALFKDDENGKTLLPSFIGQFDGIVLSPGPGTPQDQPPLSHFVISDNPDVPILGVCLGHQLITLAYGGSVDLSPAPIHGQDHRIFQQKENRSSSSTCAGTKPIYPSLFQNLPGSFRVVRYHSLCSYDLPKSIMITAKSLDDVVQGIQHDTYPHYGVQFHPESIGTENGMILLENFVRIVQERKDSQKMLKEESKFDHPINLKSWIAKRESKIVPVKNEKGDDTLETRRPDTQSVSRFRVMMHRLSLPCTHSPLQVFDKFYAHQTHTIWLDSSSYPSRGELDIMAASCRSGDIIEYHLRDNNNESGYATPTDILSRLEEELFSGRNDTESVNTYANQIGWVQFDGSNNDDNKNDNDKEYKVLEWVEEKHAHEVPPFDYRGGFLGFLGYEVRHDTQRYLKNLEGGPLTKDVIHGTTGNKNTIKNETETIQGKRRVPTAAFFLARQSMVYHHPTDTWYLIGLVEDDKDITENIKWMKATNSVLLSSLENEVSKNESIPFNLPSDFRRHVSFAPNRPKNTYTNDIVKCQEYIKKGESYELCLTNQLEAYIDTNVSTFELYKIIRRVNPAPYSSYLRWNVPSSCTGKEKRNIDHPLLTSLVICSSSPERFMSVSRQKPHPEISSYLQAEAKPIKGTCARVIPQNGVCFTDAESREDERRARSLELSLKNRAENLMIVDLLRNDMSRVCKTGSVHVSKLMDIESFATVHQMVSTVRGTLSDSYNSIDLLRASFPGGSMTGAPKIRTMELLEELEQNVDRGPYAGSIGYISVNGCMDMNIMIRSAAVTPSEKGNDEWKVSIGAGGAITALSDAEDEYDEMMLKARAVLAAVDKWASLIDGDKFKMSEAKNTIHTQQRKI